MKIGAKALAQVLGAVSFLALVDVPVTLRAGGQVVDKARRDELLAQCMAGAYVELELDVKAFEQEAGKSNRNFIRHRDGALMDLGRSGKGTPFLRDHRQGDSLARAGTVVASRTEKVAEGHYVIHQTVKLTASWAVELALRGLISTVSIGWHPTGPVMCSACNAEIFSVCWHWPGDKLREVDLGEAGKKLKRDSTGDITVEWIFTESELVETSIVPVPAVPSAHIEDIRAALTASIPGLRSASEREGGLHEDPDPDPHKENDMDPELLKLLGLAPTATKAEVLAAIEAKLKEAGADKAELAIAKASLSTFQTDIDGLKADKAKRDQDTFVLEALSSGRMAKGEEPMVRALYEASPERATKLMADRKAGSVTPVGAPRQSAVDPTPTLTITGGARPSMSIADRRDRAIAVLAANPEAAVWATVFGLESKGRFQVPATLSATTISNNAELEPARIGFHAAFLETAAGEPDPAMMLATEVPSSKKEENYSWIGDLPGMLEWKTDRMLKVLEAYGFAIRNKKWEASLRVKNDDIADDSLGLLGPLISDMGANARLHPGILVARLLLNGFAGTAFPDLGDGLAFDGDFFFSTTHATGSNKLTVAFSAANLATAAQKLREQKRFDGGNLYAQGSHLFVGISDEALAEKVMTQEMLTGGETNTQKGKYKLVVTPEWANGEWALADLRGAVRPVLFQNREALTTSAVGGSSNNDTVGFMYDEAWFGAKARYNAGYFDFRRMVGSKP